MHFASWAGLWFGLTLPTILLLYILKRRYTDTPVSSHLLWNRVLRESEANRPWQRLRNNLLLLLQLAAAALLVLAAMQPFIYARGAAKGHVVIVIDRSASMTASASSLPTGNSSEAGSGGGAPGSTEDDAVSRLKEAKRMVLTDWGSPGRSRITLISMGAEPQILLTEEKSSSKIKAAIEGITPSFGKIGYKETMSLAAALTAKEDDGEIVVYTDGQWPESADGLPFHVPVRVKQPGAGIIDNLSVLQFGVRTGTTSSGEEATLSAIAAIKNEATAARSFSLTVYAGKTPVDSREYKLGPGEQAGYSFEGLPAADYYKLQMDSGDGYPLDDSLYAFPGETRSKRALLVTEGNLFLEKALQLAGTEVTKAAPSDTPPSVKGDLDFIVLDGFQPADGGDAWNTLLASKPVWSIASDATGTPTAISDDDAEITTHPVTDHIGFAETHITAVRSTETPTWGKALVSVGGVPLIIGGTENGQRRLLFTFNLHESDLPLRPEFPVLVQNAADWLGASSAKALGRETAGAKLEIGVSAKTSAARWVTVENKGDAGTAAPSEVAAETVNGGVASTQTVPPIPGLYRFEETETDGTVRSSFLEVIADPAESALANRTGLSVGSTTADGEGLSEGGAGSDNGNGSSGVSATVSPDGTGQPGSSAASSDSMGVDRSRLPLIQWFALVAILIIFVEWGVYRRGNSL
ncbi:vWA domain-containing protein [Gorillibacterium timonense]|uniref:vWA domain-containing protein n=1 Tax=Gorillibacterium timonense TaxID=1689269 RepID=UPI00071D0770|nr:BatA and WFA domain-containing protein [Gorillibacterium timonense]